MDSIESQQYDRGMWLLERLSLATLRSRLLVHAYGRTLEIGAGTGVNLPLYRPDISIAAIDLHPAHLAAAADKARRHGRHHAIAVACANAQLLPFGDDEFDTVVGTLVFCSINEPEVALAEIRRVLKPGGRFLLLEHVRGQTLITRLLTDWLHPVWYALQGECHLNRETAATVAGAGFQIDHSSQHAGGILQTIHATNPAD